MRLQRRGLLSLIVAVALALGALAPHQAAAWPRRAGGLPIVDIPLTLDFAGTAEPAALTVPDNAAGPLPAVLMVAGAGPEDLDATICDAAGRMLSRNFAVAADAFAADGVAVLRYSKRHVSGPCTTEGPLPDLAQELEDAGTALQTLAADPLVDPTRIFVYGWSEGSVIAANLVAQTPGLDGLILQGPVAEDWYDILLRQYRDVSVPYLRSFTADGDTLTSASLAAAAQGDGGVVAKSLLTLLVQRGSPPDQPRFNPGFDPQGTGQVRIDEQLLPELPRVLEQLFAPGGPFRAYAPMLALPVVYVLAENGQLSAVPVLIVQGRLDANVPAGDAVMLAHELRASGNDDVTLHVYAGLGHSLGPAASVIDDNFRPIAAQPLDDVRVWLVAHATN